MTAHSTAKVAQSKSVPSTQNPHPVKATRPVENDHNVYILGAGFSADAGLPMINGFLTRMRDSHPWLEEQPDRQWEASVVARVLGFRLAAASAAYWVNLDLENIEELFSLASASTDRPAQTCNEILKIVLDDDIKTAIAATLDYAGKTKIVAPLCFNSSELKAAKVFWLQTKATSSGELTIARYVGYVAKLLGMFKDGSVEGQNTFITFNYDTVLEDALENLKVPFHYGFTGKIPSSPPTILHRAVFDTSSKAQADMSGIPVLKLHGSVNWARSKESDDEGIPVAAPLTVYGAYENVRVPNMLVPELVPPTWKKEFQNELQQVWSGAVNAIQTATNIVIIGFSMPPTDTHFKYLMAAGLQQNVSLRRILFVNPSVKELEQRARKLLRRDYVNSLGDSSFPGSKPIQFTPLNLESFVNSGWLQSLGRPSPIGSDLKPMVGVA